MITETTFRKIALSLPEAREQDFRGRPSFRVGCKIFATLHADEGYAVVKLPLADQSALVKSDPRKYSLMSFSYVGFTNVNLRHVNAGEVRELIDHAWRGVAAKRMVASYDKASK
jgi:hypothetical protein